MLTLSGIFLFLKQLERALPQRNSLYWWNLWNWCVGWVDNFAGALLPPTNLPFPPSVFPGTLFSVASQEQRENPTMSICNEQGPGWARQIGLEAKAWRELWRNCFEGTEIFLQGSCIGRTVYIIIRTWCKWKCEAPCSDLLRISGRWQQSIELQHGPSKHGALCYHIGCTPMASPCVGITKSFASELRSCVNLGQSLCGLELIPQMCVAQREAATIKDVGLARELQGR